MYSTVAGAREIAWSLFMAGYDSAVVASIEARAIVNVFFDGWADVHRGVWARVPHEVRVEGMSERWR